MFQLVFQDVPTLESDLTPGPAAHGLRTVENGLNGAIASKIASQRPRIGRFRVKCSNLHPKMFQDVPTLKSRRQYRTSESRFFTIFWPFSEIAMILREKRAISWCSKFQLCLRGKVYGVFIFSQARIGRRSWNLEQSWNRGYMAASITTIATATATLEPHPSHPSEPAEQVP